MDSWRTASILNPVRWEHVAGNERQVGKAQSALASREPVLRQLTQLVSLRAAQHPRIMARVLHIPVRAGATITLPADVLAALGSPQEVYVVVDAARQLITLSVQHPDIVHNEAVLLQLAQLSAGVPLEEYGAPVPDSFLQRRGKEPSEGDR